jgi:hypothetical protein
MLLEGEEGPCNFLGLENLKFDVRQKERIPCKANLHDRNSSQDERKEVTHAVG